MTSMMKAPFQSWGRKRGSTPAPRLLEMPGKQREAEQEAQEIGENHPFVPEMSPEPAQSRAFLESGEAQLVQGDHGEADESDVERVPVEQRDAQQGEGEQDEIDRDAEHRKTVRGACRNWHNQQGSARPFA